MIRRKAHQNDVGGSIFLICKDVIQSLLLKCQQKSKHIWRIDKKPVLFRLYLNAFAVDDPTYEDAHQITYKQTIKGKVLLCKETRIFLFVVFILVLRLFFKQLLIALFDLIGKI